MMLPWATGLHNNQQLGILISCIVIPQISTVTYQLGPRKVNQLGISGHASPKYASEASFHFSRRSTPRFPTTGNSGTWVQSNPVAQTMVSHLHSTPSPPMTPVSVIRSAKVNCTLTLGCWMAAIYGSPGVIRRQLTGKLGRKPG